MTFGSIVLYSNGVFTLVYFGTGTGDQNWDWKMGCMRLYRTFHTTQEPGPQSGPEKSRMGSKPIFRT